MLPSVYTDINVQNGTLATGGVGATPIVPYRNKTVAAKGLLKNGKTAISEVTDGLSNTIAILECAGRDERFVSQYLRGPCIPSSGGRGRRAARTARHRFWRWADPGLAFGTSGQPNNKGMPTNEGVPWPTTTATAGNQAGPNEEPYSYHPGGVNALFGDGSVRFVKDSVNLVAVPLDPHPRGRRDRLVRPVLSRFSTVGTRSGIDRALTWTEADLAEEASRWSSTLPLERDRKRWLCSMQHRPARWVLRESGGLRPFGLAPVLARSTKSRARSCWPTASR